MAFERKPLQRWLSGLRRTIGNRVMQECIRRFKSSSLRHEKPRKNGVFCYFRGFFAHFRTFSLRRRKCYFLPVFCIYPTVYPTFSFEKSANPLYLQGFPAFCSTPLPTPKRRFFHNFGLLSAPSAPSTRVYHAHIKIYKNILLLIM